jgi:hypothetical protein
MAIKLTLLSQGQQALVDKLETGTNALNKTRKALHKRRREAAQIKIKTSTNAPTSTVLNFATSGKCTPSAKQELRSPVEANAPLSQEPLQFRNSAKDSDNNKSKVSDQINVLYDSRSIAGIKKRKMDLNSRTLCTKYTRYPFRTVCYRSSLNENGGSLCNLDVQDETRSASEVQRSVCAFHDCQLCKLRCYEYNADDSSIHVGDPVFIGWPEVVLRDRNEGYV